MFACDEDQVKKKSSRFFHAVLPWLKNEQFLDHCTHSKGLFFTSYFGTIPILKSKLKSSIFRWIVFEFSHENYSKCRRIWIFDSLAFSTHFCLIKTDLSVNTVCPQASDFQKLAKMDIFFCIFNYLLTTQNVNEARFARNVEWDFSCDFQTPCSRRYVTHQNLWCRMLKNWMNGTMMTNVIVYTKC